MASRKQKLQAGLDAFDREVKDWMPKARGGREAALDALDMVLEDLAPRRRLDVAELLGAAGEHLENGRLNGAAQNLVMAMEMLGLVSG